jgi:hypothetical protein
MNISKDKLFRLRYRDYFSQWSEPWVFSQWTQESFITHRRHISRMWRCREQQLNSGMMIRISKHILEFIDANTKFSGHCEQGLREIWISLRLPRINENFKCLEVQLNQMELSADYVLPATYGIQD